MPPQPLTLKQRLAALSLAPSSPSSPFSPSIASPTGSATPTLGSPLTPTMKTPVVMPKKRGSSLLFSPPWMKKSFQDSETSYSAMERARDVMSRVIFQAGVDYECVFSFIRTYLFLYTQFHRSSLALRVIPLTAFDTVWTSGSTHIVFLLVPLSMSTKTCAESLKLWIVGHARCEFKDVLFEMKRKLKYVYVFVGSRVVIAASELPDPREISYDLLLTCVLTPAA